MTSTGETTDTQDFAPATVQLNLEVVTIAVSDVDRAKRFYQSLGCAWMPTSPPETASGWSN